MRDRLYGEHYPDSFLDVPRPIREPSMATLGDYIQHLREVDNQSYKCDESSQPCIACEPNKRGESGFQHICPNNPILNCNCSDPKFCAEQPNDNGWIKCPDSGKLCSVIDCPDGCKGDKPNNHDGFADNIEYTHIEGQPIPNTKREATNSGWPCVVVGGFCETGANPTEHVYGTEPSTGASERLDSTGPSDGSYVSTNH